MNLTNPLILLDNGLTQKISWYLIEYTAGREVSDFRGCWQRKMRPNLAIRHMSKESTCGSISTWSGNSSNLERFTMRCEFMNLAKQIRIVITLKLLRLEGTSWKERETPMMAIRWRWIVIEICSSVSILGQGFDQRRGWDAADHGSII